MLLASTSQSDMDSLLPHRDRNTQTIGDPLAHTAAQVCSPCATPRRLPRLRRAGSSFLLMNIIHGATPSTPLAVSACA